MAIDLTLKSVEITNREATPRVLNNPGLGGGGELKVARGYIASVTASLSATSVIRFCEVPSSAVVHKVVVDSGAQTAGKFDIGVYRNNKDGGAAVDQDFFTTDLDCAAAVIAQDVTRKATSAYSIAEGSEPLWDALGMSADPCSTLDICGTVHTTDVTTGTGAMSVVVYYS